MTSTIVMDPIRAGARFIARDGNEYVITQVTKSMIWFKPIDGGSGSYLGKVKRGSEWFDVLRPACEHQPSGWLGHPDDQIEPEDNPMLIVDDTPETEPRRLPPPAKKRLIKAS